MSRIINLVGKEGLFETKVISGNSHPIIRSFGLWSFSKVSPGDYVIRPTKNGLVCHLIREAHSTFCGSDGNMFWKGEMIGLNVEEFDSHLDLIRYLA